MEPLSFPRALTWVEISKRALVNNLKEFRRMAPTARLAPVVKANAYGHGLVETARILAEARADWLCVNAVYEARALREAGIELPIYVLGFVPDYEFEDVLQLGLRVVVYSSEAVRGMSRVARARGSIPLHIKLETGTNRQGVSISEAVELARLINSLPGVHLEGISSHYADIEDTTDHSYAKGQLARFEEGCQALREAGIHLKIRSFSNSAATILWPETHFELVRVGISLYGMWPSKETMVAAVMAGRDWPDLQPVLTWKTVVAQVKQVKPGEYIGYGRSFQATHPTRLAVLPVGYYDGYDRSLSNLAHVLINGAIAPVRGRVCMNMTMVDVTDVGPVEPGTEVVLLGRSNGRFLPAESLAAWSSTINYEVTTRINERIPRVVVE